MYKTFNVAVMASGRGSNFEALAKNCARDDFPATLKLLVADNPEAGALNIAEKMKIETAVVDCGSRKGAMNPESTGIICNLFQDKEINLVCLAGFMRIVRGEILDKYQGRIINVHPALLPSFKGLDGQKQAFDYGVRFSGCTVHFVDRGIDTGPIIVQRVVSVKQNDSEEKLSLRILKEEHIAYSQAVRILAESRFEISGRRVIIYDE